MYNVMKRNKYFIYLTITFSKSGSDGATQYAAIADLSLREVWVIPVSSTSSQARVLTVLAPADQVPTIYPVVSVVATNRMPLNVSLLVAPLTVTNIRRKYI